MSTRGRKAALKAIDGGLSGVPAMPSIVPVEMAEEWKSISTDLVERQLLTPASLGLVETYILARWTVREAQKAIEEHGPLTQTAHKMLKPNPACGLMSKAMEATARIGAELGISPAARSKAQFKGKGGKRDKGAPAGLDI